MAEEDWIPALRVGLLPTQPTLALLRLYAPLRQGLLQGLGRPVEFYTAANFRAHLGDLRSQSFDLLITAPHLGVIAADLGYVPLFRYKVELRPAIIVAKNGGITSPAQLRNQRVLTADSMAALSLVAEYWLERDFNLVSGRDYDLIEASTHGNAIRGVALGDASAAISGTTPLRQASEAVRDKVSTIECPVVAPHQSILAHPRLGAGLIAEIRQTLAAFPDSSAGRDFFAATGFQGLLPLTEDDIQAARPYTDLLLKRIG